MIRWPDLNLPPINLYNVPVLVTYKEAAKVVRHSPPDAQERSVRSRRRQVNSLAQLLAMPH